MNNSNLLLNITSRPNKYIKNLTKQDIEDRLEIVDKYIEDKKSPLFGVYLYVKDHDNNQIKDLEIGTWNVIP